MKKRILRKCASIISAIGILYSVYNIFVNMSFKTTYYNIESEKLKNDFKAVLLTDLHDKEYGEGNRYLLEAIGNEHPDVIFCAGDMINTGTQEFDKIKSLLYELGRIAPVYYSFGNHEYRSMLNGNFSVREEIRDINNVHIMKYGAEDTEINGNEIRIGAFSLAPENWEKYGPEWFQIYEDESKFQILLSHYPWIIPEYIPKSSLDVVLCGHAHGGQVHLWKDVGLFAPGYGFFPRYTSGMHNINGTTEIVSRGLGDHTIVPRINNQPELVVVNFIARGE